MIWNKPQSPFVSMRQIINLDDNLIKIILSIVIGFLCILMFGHFVKKLIAKHKNVDSDTDNKTLNKKYFSNIKNQ